MPNYYENVLTASGDEKEIARLKRQAGGKNDEGEAVPFQFERFIPAPFKFEDKKIGGVTDEHYRELTSWRMSNWGTRNDAVNTKTTFDGREKVSYSYSTASAPGEEFVENVSREYPDLEFNLEYFSLDAGHKGRITVRDGHVENRQEGLLEPEGMTEEEK